jgi:aerobic-type carbon monoxide dehydrogenase small subunit (CoxS/CutS family)
MRIQLTVNGSLTSVEVPPLKTLLDVLREDLGLIGTKGVCRSGFCGTCLVLMGEDLVNSCQIPAFRAQNAQITTVEGLSDSKVYASLNRSLKERRISTCHYCTPAYLMAMATLLSKSKNPTEAEIQDVVASILCVCTGQHGLTDGVKPT